MNDKEVVVVLDSSFGSKYTPELNQSRSNCAACANSGSSGKTKSPRIIDTENSFIEYLRELEEALATSS